MFCLSGGGIAWASVYCCQFVYLLPDSLISWSHHVDMGSRCQVNLGIVIRTFKACVVL